MLVPCPVGGYLVSTYRYVGAGVGVLVLVTIPFERVADFCRRRVVGTIPLSIPL